MRVSISRVVTVLTPVFSAVAAVGAAWLAKHFPGLPPLSPTDLTAIEVSVFVTTTGIAAKWLHGSSQWERLVKAYELVKQTEGTATKSTDNLTAVLSNPAVVAMKPPAPVVPLPDTRDQGWPNPPTAA